MRYAGIVILSVMFASLVGCNGLATSTLTTTTEWKTWCQEMGGELPASDPRVVHLQAIGTALATGAVDVPITLHVLANDAVCAYSYPTGDVFVTAGMADLGDDRIVTAAIAHELGHLISDGHAQARVSLRGCLESMDAERKADAVGCALLASKGYTTQDMIQMLRCVQQATSSQPCRACLQRRIELLSSPIQPK